MTIAFDFDGTLDDKRMQDFALKLKRSDIEIWIVTMRRDNEFNNNILKPVLNRLGLSKYNVVFCDEKPKWEFLKAINADLYIDNITDEFEIIKNHTNTIPLLWV